MTTLTNEQLIQRGVDYMTFLQSKIPIIRLNNMLLMDKTAIFFQDTWTQTIDFEGWRPVIMKSTGFLSMRITACMSLWADGCKAPCKDNFSVCQKAGPLLACTQTNAWVNSNLIVKWINAVFPVVDVSMGKCIVWDSCRTHISKHCINRNIKMVVIPWGCTPYLQAGDIGIFRELKDNLSKIIEAWKNSEEFTYTWGGNPKPPPPVIVESWVRDAWKSVSILNIQNSINAAGFSNDFKQWHIVKHIIYGQKFVESWENCQPNKVDSFCTRICWSIGRFGYWWWIIKFNFYSMFLIVSV